MAGVDAWEDEGLQQEFLDAVRHAGTSLRAEVPEAAQRRLFGLHCRATQGPAPQAPPPGHEEQWRAWSEASGLSQRDAMREYVDFVGRLDPGFVLSAGEGGPPDRPGSELPAGLREQLAAAGFREAAAQQDPRARAAENVFEAARAGSGLVGFLPAQRDAVDMDGLTPLIHAVDGEKADSVAELLLASADVNLADPQGCGPLHYAALLGATALAEQLVAAGADPRRQDVDGQTPADAAREEGHAELASALDEAKARFVG
mmetsp:Transcript_137404/g.426913  ORF Transcript_137404/g.426913 Transcript_137404/m.426913 type:complete len:259 (-) Transcript_137404:43-819(-)